jgi:monovalent cation:H+ antiporter-2, CPA2 family
MSSMCRHLDQIAHSEAPPEPGCSECIAIGQTWKRLRLCLVCGIVACCDESPEKHTTAHVKSSGHPVVLSLAPEEAWAYCYSDDTYFDLESALAKR